MFAWAQNFRDYTPTSWAKLQFIRLAAAEFPFSLAYLLIAARTLALRCGSAHVS